MPPDEAVFFNTRSFRNKQEGVFVHNSRNLAIEGAILADNRIQFDFDRGAENIRLQNASLFGVTDQYKYVLDTQPDAPAHSSVIGIELHGFTLDGTNDGALIRDVGFYGFEDTRASHSALIEIDADATHGHFDYWTTLQNVGYNGDVTPAQFDFRNAMANGIDNIYLTDIGSGMRPAGSAATGVSTVISNTTAMTHFLDMSKCESFPERAYMYCGDTCLRSVVLAVPATMTDDFVLRINKQGSASDFVEINGNFHNETVNHDDTGGPDKVANSWIRKRRYFSAALPAAENKYVFRFVRGGQMDWPTSVEVTFEKPQCPTTLTNNRVVLGKPSPSLSVCEELIKNGDMELPDYPYWLHHETGLKLDIGEGISSSMALSEIDQRAPANGLIGQYLDTRCFQRGLQYEVRAWVKLMRNGAPFACDAANVCPKARLKIRTADDDDGLEFSDFNMEVVSYFERPYRQNGWNRLRGTFTVDARVEAGSSVLFFVERGRSGVRMLLDDVSVRPVLGDCKDLVFNGDFANGKSSFWHPSASSATMTMRNGNSLKMTGRNALTHSPEQYIRTGCMIEGERYIASARVRLENSNGSLFICDPTRTSGAVCPRMRLRSFVLHSDLQSFNSSAHDGGSIAVTNHGTSNGWYIMSGIFIANEFDAHADRSTLSFDQVSGQKDFVIDDASITLLEQNCNELLLNGDAEYGDTPSFWSHWSPNGGEKITLVPAGNNNQAFKVHQRDLAGDGIHQFIDPRCLMAGTTWKLSARMRLVSKTSGQGVTCEPSDQTRFVSACPPVRIFPWTSGAKGEEQAFYMTNSPNWSANSFNDYEVEFTVNNTLANSDRVSIGIRGYNTDWDVVVDDLSLRPVP